MIFDIDRVLADPETLHKRAKKMVFWEFGIEFPALTYDNYKRRPDATMFQEVLSSAEYEEHPLREYKPKALAVQAMQTDNWIPGIEVIDGVSALPRVRA